MRTIDEEFGDESGRESMGDPPLRAASPRNVHFVAKTAEGSAPPPVAASHAAVAASSGISRMAGSPAGSPREQHHTEREISGKTTGANSGAVVSAQV